MSDRADDPNPANHRRSEDALAAAGCDERREHRPEDRIHRHGQREVRAEHRRGAAGQERIQINVRGRVHCHLDRLEQSRDDGWHHPAARRRRERWLSTQQLEPDKESGKARVDKAVAEEPLRRRQHLRHRARRVHRGANENQRT
ncbi:MAG: hypothetical protein LC791_09360 [Acidobacteria bacterium]|nr:hypothetical protein [Acidobacteriota bacterium]